MLYIYTHSEDIIIIIIIIIITIIIIIIITYEEQQNKGHINRTISQLCHNKIVCPLGNFVACDWLS